MTCDNGVFVYQLSNAEIGVLEGVDVCYLHENCSTPHTLASGVLPRHGRSPLSVTAKFSGYAIGSMLCAPYSINWGDGVENFPSYYNGTSCRSVVARSHTYSSPGSYTLTMTVNASTQWQTLIFSSAAQIRVDPPQTVSSNNQSQLASALTALQGALQALLQLFK